MAKMLFITAFAFVLLAFSASAGVNVTLVAPLNVSANNTAGALTFWYIASIQGSTTAADAVKNCTLVGNFSGTWATISGNSTTVVNATNNSNYFTYAAADARNISWNVNCTLVDTAGNILGWNYSNSSITATGKDNFTLTRDTTAPTYNATLTNAAGTYNGLNITYVNAGERVNITLNVNDTTSWLSAVNISVLQYQTARFWPCYEATGLNGVNRTMNASCTFITNTTAGGTYGVFLAGMIDVAGNSITPVSNLATFDVYNAEPHIITTDMTTSYYALNLSKMELRSANFSQRKMNYSIPLPFFMGGGVLATGGAQIIPMYFSSPPFAMNASSTQENLVYNYTMTFNASGVNGTAGTDEIVVIKLNVPGLALAQELTQPIYSPQGQFNMTMYIPNMTMTQGAAPTFNDVFHIWLNGTRYVNTGAVTTAHPINGTWTNSNMGSGNITLWLNASNSSVTNGNYTITLLFCTGPMAQINSQTMSGFDTTSPPQLGSNYSQVFTINLTATNRFYAPDNVSVSFMLPTNATVKMTNGSWYAFNITSGVQLQVFSAGAWVNVTTSLRDNSYGIDGWNYTTCINITENVSDAIDNGANHSVCMTEYKYNISNKTGLSWRYGQNISLRLVAGLQFPAPAKSVPAGTAGTNTYRADVYMGSEAGLLIPTEDVPGFAAAPTKHVYIDGQELASTQYSAGSIIISGASLASGAHTIVATYTVDTPTYSATPIGGGGGAAATTATVIAGTVAADGTASVTVPSTIGAAVSEVDITAAAQIVDLKVTIQNAGTTAPSEATVAYSGTVYSYMVITTTAPAASIKEADIKFSVDKSWLTAQNADASQVKLARFADNKWNELVTTKLSEDTTKVYYSAKTPGFSVFAVTLATAAPEQPAGNETVTPGAEQPSAPGAEQPSAPGAGPSAPGAEQPAATTGAPAVAAAGGAMDYTWLVIAVIVVLVAIGAVYYFKMGKQ